MRIVCMSDTHGRHWRFGSEDDNGERLELPDGDVLIHAGDHHCDYNCSQYHECSKEFLGWISSLPHKHKIVVAGNHDWDFFEKKVESIPDGVTYLEESGCRIGGVNFWGSPWTPWFHDWAWNFPKDDISVRRDHWARIPANTDVLITHGPPHLTLDKTIDGRLVGDSILSEQVSHIKPSLHIFGHIHESYGMVKKNGTTYINAALCDDWYRLARKPIVVDI